MTWTVLFHEAFDAEFEALEADLQDELLAHPKLLATFGPDLGRPTVDTLKGSRQAILLVGGDKGGADQRRFYKRLLTVADARYDDHLATLSQSNKESKNGKKTR